MLNALVSSIEPELKKPCNQAFVQYLQGSITQGLLLRLLNELPGDCQPSALCLARQVTVAACSSCVAETHLLQLCTEHDELVVWCQEQLPMFKVPSSAAVCAITSCCVCHHRLRLMLQCLVLWVRV